MKRKALSIVMMKRLEELGIDTSDASMIYNRGRLVNIDFPVDKEAIKQREDMSFAYTLDDILNKLPNIKYEEEEYIPISYKSGDLWCVDYHCTGDFNKTFTPDFVDIMCVCENLIDAAGSMLLWCLENKYV